MNVTLLTPIPSPYQVELWDAIARDGAISPRVIFVERTHSDRQWVNTQPLFKHVFIEDGLAATVIATDWVRSTDLFVASWYADPDARRLMAARLATGRPWVYWGEKPGFSRWGVLGRVRRWFRLSSLRRSQASVWGIGTSAVEAWKREFGKRRHYFNVPYFSDLARFSRPNTLQSSCDGVRFLYSGQLTHRKGVDLLAEAFAGVASSHPDASLELVGSGHLEPALKASLSRFGGRVRFAGFQQWDQLPATYHRADVLITPSRHDGWGLVIPEGLAAGLPVISTNRTGAALDLIQPGLNGWVVPAGSVSALRGAMAEAAAQSAEKRAEMSAAACTSVANHQLADGVRKIVAAAHAATEQPA